MPSADFSGFNKEEKAILKRLRRPELIQAYLDEEVDYNTEVDGETYKSPRLVLRDRLAHCLEGALFAATCLRFHGHEPLIVDLVAVKDDDHIIAPFRKKRLWGAIAQSNFSGLGFRPAVYRSLRELVLSYFPSYFNDDRQYTLRRYSEPIDLSQFDDIDWMTTEKDLYPIVRHTYTVPHTDIIPKGMRLPQVRKREFDAGCVGRANK